MYLSSFDFFFSLLTYANLSLLLFRDLFDSDIMELPGSSTWKENDAGFITNDISDSMASTATFADLISSDCIPPRKRPKRLSVSCVERGRVVILIARKI